MPLEKTLQQLEAELATVEQAMNAPGVDQKERKLYQRGAARIRALIAEKKNTGAPDQVKVRPIRPQVIQTPPAVKKTATPANVKETDMGVITALSSGAMKRVMIKWEDSNEAAEPLILTEGETRSRFTTALRDLAQSKFASQERWEDLQAYVTYAKACTYYLALIEFWGQAPTAQQLELAPLGAIRQQIFLMIQESCEAVIS